MLIATKTKQDEMAPRTIEERNQEGKEENSQPQIA